MAIGKTLFRSHKLRSCSLLYTALATSLSQQFHYNCTSIDRLFVVCVLHDLYLHSLPERWGPPFSVNITLGVPCCANLPSSFPYRG